MQNQQHTLAVAIVLSSVMAMTGCTLTGDDSEPLDESQSELAGGREVTTGSDVARVTVLLTTVSSAGRVGCTATLVDEGHALTAAHCTLGLDRAPDAVLVFATRFAPSAVTRPVTGFVTPTKSTNDDIAVVSFSGGLPPGSSTIVVAPNLTLAVDDPVVLAGFGRTAKPTDARGILRQGDGRHVSTNQLLRRNVLRGTATVCSGDSGGPDFVRVGGRLRQIGVHVSGACGAGERTTSTDVRSWVTWLQSETNNLRVDNRVLRVDR